MIKMKKIILLLLAFNLNAQDWTNYAIEDIIYNYNGNVSPFYQESDRKTLLKFGSNENIGNSVKSTIMTLNGSETEETYVSTNIIDTVSSSSASDTEILSIEGHTVDGNGDFTFVIQSATLNGRNKVTLTTPLARVSRVYNSNGNDLVGTIYVYEDTAITNGEPTDDTKIHIMIDIGFNQSEKAATTISSSQWWALNNIYSSVLEKSAAFCSVILEVREKGKIFRNQVELGTTTGYNADHDFKPFLIIKPNSDVRLSAICSGPNINVAGGIQGYLIRTK